MKAGDQVTVAPLDAPDRGATGKVVMLSNNGNSIVVAIGDAPSWAMSHVGGIPLHPEHGFTVLARLTDSGWEEMFGGRLFSIEPVRVQ